MKNNVKKILKTIAPVVLVFLFIATRTNIVTNVIKDINKNNTFKDDLQEVVNQKTEEFDYTYKGQFVEVVNNNVPYFTISEIAGISLAQEGNRLILNDLDELGRTQSAMMLISKDDLNYDGREDISEVKPSGYKQAKYEDLIENGGWLYNRCHLIAYLFSGLNAEEKNLFTCTYQTNTEGMLPYEVAIATYLKDTGNHVLYRVTPYYKGNNLLASGVLLEATSIEDAGLSLCVYIHNIQNGVDINYQTGASSRAK